jgi:hypothetical protein
VVDLANPLSWLLAGSIVLAVVGGGLAWWVSHRRRQRSVERRLREACRAVLADFSIPDGSGGQIQVQYAALTPRGILVLDIKDVEGHVFGSEAMQDWTVIAEDRRFTFANPQPGLWDRVAAIKRFAPEVPVTGFVAFTSRAIFSKGQPRSVALLGEVLDELDRQPASVDGQDTAAFLPGWERLRETAVQPQVDWLNGRSRRG